MNAIRNIRIRLGKTQAELADALDVTQGNVSLYENGQSVPQAAAAKLIDFAKTLGLEIGYDHVYGAVDLPAPTTQEGA